MMSTSNIYHTKQKNNEEMTCTDEKPTKCLKVECYKLTSCVPENLQVTAKAKNYKPASQIYGIQGATEVHEISNESYLRILVLDLAKFDDLSMLSIRDWSALQVQTKSGADMLELSQIGHNSIILKAISQIKMH